jgi:hypothetical protein
MNLYGIARWANTIGAILSGDPHRIGVRAKNIVVGRTLARGGVWQGLWRAWWR